MPACFVKHSLLLFGERLVPVFIDLVEDPIDFSLIDLRHDVGVFNPSSRGGPGRFPSPTPKPIVESF